MEYAYNSVTLVGNVTEVSIKEPPDKNKYCYVRLAVGRPFGGADYISVKFYGTDVEICRQLKKGDAIIITGAFTVDSYERGGETVYTTYIKGLTIGKALKPTAEAT